MSTPPAKTSLLSSMFILAGVTNFSILIFSQGMRSSFFSSLYPALFSWAGILMVLLWGLAYISVAQRYAQVPELVAVFAIEKFFYVGTWVFWLMQQGAHLKTIFFISPLTGIFYGGYGLLDLGFGCFFAWVYFNLQRQESKP